jgi:hypothetical protein
VKMGFREFILNCIGLEVQQRDFVMAVTRIRVRIEDVSGQMNCLMFKEDSVSEWASQSVYLLVGDSVFDWVTQSVIG